MVNPRQIGLAYGMVETTASIAVITAPLLAGFLYEKDPYSVYRVSIYLVVGVILLNLIIAYINSRRGKIDRA
jgi:MFS family permease